MLPEEGRSVWSKSLSSSLPVLERTAKTAMSAESSSGEAVPRTR